MPLKRDKSLPLSVILLEEFFEKILQEELFAENIFTIQRLW